MALTFLNILKSPHKQYTCLCSWPLAFPVATKLRNVNKCTLPPPLSIPLVSYRQKGDGFAAMSTRSRRTRSRGEGHAHGLFNAKESVPNTDIHAVIRGVPKGTFSADTMPACKPPTIDTVLHVPDCPYGLDEIHFVLWYTLTTTLSPDKIAELFNHFFTPAELIDRWTIADIINAIETRWEANGKSFGQNFRLRRPTAHGTCPCDFKHFKIDCVDVKRTTKTRQNHKYLSIAASLWDQSAAELVLCPRGNSKDHRHHVIAKDTQPPRLLLNFDELLPLAHKAYLHATPLIRSVLTFAFWLAMLHLWSIPPENLAFPLQRTLSSYLHHDLTGTVAALQLLFERILDALPTFTILRTTPFGELAWQAFIDFWQIKIVIGVALELCSVLNILPDFFHDYPTWYMPWLRTGGLN